MKKSSAKNFCSKGELETPRPFSYGYTLTELLVVLAIMGLMAALAPPVLTGSQHRFQTKAEIYRLAARLEAAHSQAIDTQTTICVPLPAQGFVSFYPDGSATGMKLQQSGMTISVAPISGSVTVSGR